MEGFLSSDVLSFLLGEVILYDNQIVLYRSNIDIFFYVVGSMEENELILLSMLNAFYDAVSTLLRYVHYKRALLSFTDTFFIN